MTMTPKNPRVTVEEPHHHSNYRHPNGQYGPGACEYDDDDIGVPCTPPPHYYNRYSAAKMAPYNYQGYHPHHPAHYYYERASCPSYMHSPHHPSHH